MNKSIFSLRNLIVISTLILSSAACASAPAGGVSGEEGYPAAEEATPAMAPVFTQPVVELLPTQTMSAPTQISMPPAIPESRRLTLEFPPSMKAGVEGDIIRLTLEVDDLGNITPTAKVEGNVVVGEVIQVPDLYETHNVTAEAQLDMAGMIVQPPDAIYEPLKRGQSVTFHWSIRPQDTGKYRGTVWLHLNFENRQTGEKDRIAVSAQIVEIEAVDFFGMSFNVARTSGVVGSIIGGVIGFPFLEDILKFIFNRRKKK